MSNDKRLYLSQIFKAYNQTKAHARRAGDLKRIDRLNKALGILLSSQYYQADKAAYQPSTSDCQCKDWEFRHAAKRQYTGPCKHMLAEAMLLAGSTEGAWWNIYSMFQFKSEKQEQSGSYPLFVHEGNTGVYRPATVQP